MVVLKKGLSVFVFLVLILLLIEHNLTLLIQFNKSFFLQNILCFLLLFFLVVTMCLNDL